MNMAVVNMKEAQDKEEPLGVVTEIAAINTLNMAEEVAHLEAKGIIHAIRCQDDMQEASGAYKDIEEVIANELNLIRWVLKIPTS
jgi:tRNA-splicing ligase RtcB